MKKYNKKALMVLVFSGLMLTSLAGCSKNKDSSVNDGIIKKPIEFLYGEENYNEDSSSPDYNGEDPTAPQNDTSSSDSSESGDDSGNTVVVVTDANGENVTEYVSVMDDNGEPVTEYQNVTDAAGEPVTDNNGETVTTAVQVTTAVNKTETKKSSGNSGESTTTETVKPSSDTTYVPHTLTASATWLDISKKDDFYFEDEFIQVTFKVKDNIPDGVYDVKISSPDFASFDDDKKVKPGKLVDGKIFVSTEIEEPEDTSSFDGFLVSADYASCKQGDEVTICFRLKNNPGMCAMAFCFDYDRNAMEIVECETAGSFADIERGVYFN